MPLPKIQFSKSSTDLLSVDLLIGNLVFGHYELYLWDQTGKNQTLLGEGVNNDDNTVAIACATDATPVLGAALGALPTLGATAAVTAAPPDTANARDTTGAAGADPFNVSELTDACDDDPDPASGAAP